MPRITLQIDKLDYFDAQVYPKHTSQHEVACFMTEYILPHLKEFETSHDPNLSLHGPITVINNKCTMRISQQVPIGERDIMNRYIKWLEDDSTSAPVTLMFYYTDTNGDYYSVTLDDVKHVVGDGFVSIKGSNENTRSLDCSFVFDIGQVDFVVIDKK